MILTYMILYFLFCFFIPSYRIYKTSGVNPITFGKHDNAHDLIGLYMKLAMVFILLSTLEAGGHFNLKLEHLINHDFTRYAGMTLMLVSLIWIIVAQTQMGSSWRIGIDEENITELKSTGLFKLSRNPIFTGMIASQLGFFLYHSTMLNLTILIIVYLLISIQIRLEEEFLSKTHGQSYIEFKARAPRWIIF